ncbi:enoyl-(acyl carrier protein) reductase [Listeria aquatica FSL S10-1188]|uniref:Enoyl-(Acyl carrier protein) reductase n=2 Tax=Listeria TaxID=1637 RepID=W7AXL5_9LIST|nr:enoyl-(acyl carrier protein) reductase [Listeria aquatica FSL S10-1188]
MKKKGLSCENRKGNPKIGGETKMNLTLAGKTYVVMGVANKRSIAWSIAKSLNEAGADLVFTYADDRAKKKH